MPLSTEQITKIRTTFVHHQKYISTKMVFHLLWYVNQIICVRELQVKFFSSGRFKLQFQVKVSFKCNLHAKDNIYLYYILSSSPWGDSYSIDDPLPLCFYPSPPYLPPLCWRRAESYAIRDKLKALKELTGDHPNQHQGCNNFCHLTYLTHQRPWKANTGANLIRNQFRHFLKPTFFSESQNSLYTMMKMELEKD